MQQTIRVKRRSKRRLGFVLAVLCGAGAPLRAAAAEPGEEAIDAALVRADARFVAGDLADALSILEPVCSRSARPECAFSLGAIHHGLGHCREALAHYQRYRVLAPEGEHAAEVAAALEEVEGRCGAGTARAPAPPSPVDGASVGAAVTSDRAAAMPGSASEPAPAAPSSAPAAVTAPSAPSAHTQPSVATPLGSASAASTSTSSGLGQPLMTGAFVMSGAAAVSSAVFGVLAARSAAHCDGARTYDREFIEECEERGPRYQGLWQGFAIASGAFLGIGLTVWALDADSSASVGVSATGAPLLHYGRRF